ncbi:MAG TPA: hypothetical protein DIT64_15385 [Verrucomicrobiales bacterium]|nr:hypothetical protein [Verrucomicrobiales bacterium]
MSALFTRWISSSLASLHLMGAAQDPAATGTLDAASPAAVDVSSRLGAAASTVSSLPALPDDGYWIDNAPINEVFQYLARSAGLQFFHNNELATPAFNVTGHLKLDNPRQQMEDLAQAYGLTVYQQRSTVSLLNDAQLSRLPLEVMSYELKYLRGAPLNRANQGGGGGGGGGATVDGMDGGGGTGGGGGGSQQADFEKLKAIIRPLLTREVGQIEFEEKTNTLLVTDNQVRLERIRALLAQLDKAKQQILVNVRVLRIKRNDARRAGIDWSRALGDTGTTITASQSLNALFNLPDISTITRSGALPNPTTSINKVNTDGIGLVFGNPQVQAILRALEEADIVSQEACPTIITEDNEQGTISIVDRFPVITANVTNSGAGVQNISELVRYQIDEKDPDPTTNPEKSREIGVTLSVTPTLLPDGTVRMKLRPRVAKIVELVAGQGGNVYPRVSESTVEAISRIPAGQSLFLGGFYDYSGSEGENKVPVLGSIPVIRKLFSTEQRKLEQVSLVFIITPQIYDASNAAELPGVNWQMREYSAMQPEDIADSGLSLTGDGGGNQGLAARAALPASAPRESWLRRVFTKKSSPAMVQSPAAGPSGTHGGAPYR